MSDIDPNDIWLDDDGNENVTCWQCGGDGVLDDCFEDTCVCLDAPCCTQRCDICDGKGSWALNPEGAR